jgi:hypothetical protein
MNSLVQQMMAALKGQEQRAQAVDATPTRALAYWSQKPEEAPLSLTDAIKKFNQQRAQNPYMTSVNQAFKKREGFMAPKKYGKPQEDLSLGSIFSSLYGGRFS